MATLPIPRGPDEITPEWLTSALRSGGSLSDSVTVTDFDSIVLGTGKGFTGRVLRLGVRYDGDTRAPESVIAKFPPASDEAREVLHGYRLYEREIGFYRELAERVSFRVPACYYGDLDLDSGHFVLLLEDLAPARPYDIVGGVPPEEARLVVRDMARHHAMWWEEPELEGLDWLPAFDAEAEEDEVKYAAARPVFLERVGHLLQPGVAELGGDLLGRIAAVRRGIASPPWTFLHGDFHPNNLFLNEVDGERELRVVDWQVCSRGRGPRDLMYFLTSALTSEDCEAHEEELLALYHEELVAHGVQGLGLEDLRRQYRFSLLDLLHFFTVVVAILDFEVNDEARAVRDLLVARWGGAIHRHAPGDVLPAPNGGEA